MNDIQVIQSKIYQIRGQRVMLDRDIADFYGVETKRLNEKVKRHPKRFAGEDFMFQLTQEELDDLRSRSQIATMKKGRGSNFKYLPYAFTLLGVSMLSSVLESDSAIEINRRIMRAFVTFYQVGMSLPAPNPAADVAQLRKDFEELKLDIEDIMRDQNEINEDTRLQLEAISAALAALQSKEPRQKPRRKIGFV